MSATQKDVAALAGVGRTTVAYVLFGRKRGGRISPEVCKRVRSAAKKLHYVPNRRAQALVSGKTRTVALLVVGFNEDLWVWSRIAQGTQVALLKDGYDALIHGIASDAPLEEQAEALVRQGRVDGVIAIPFASTTPPRRAPDFPLVWIDLGIRQPCPSVSHDPRTGLEQAVEHLRALGHRQVLWVGWQAESQAVPLDRLGAVQSAAVARDMTVRTVTLPVTPEELTERYVENQPVVLKHLRRLLAWPLAETAVICWNDFLAHCASAVLREQGARIPEDVSVVGFDDVRPMLHVPPLSTVSGAFSQMGAAAAELVLRQARGELSPQAAGQTSVAAPTFFIPRASSGPCRTA